MGDKQPDTPPKSKLPKPTASAGGQPRKPTRAELEAKIAELEKQLAAENARADAAEARADAAEEALRKGTAITAEQLGYWCDDEDPPLASCAGRGPDHNDSATT